MVWDAFIAVYLFLAGLGAGAFFLGALVGWAKKPLPKMRRIAYIIAPVAVVVGTLVLVFDAKAGFANPLRFFYLVTNLSSVMAWGVIILSAFIIVSAVDLVILLVKKETPKVLDVIGMVLAVCTAAYTGVLLGDAGMAFPLWNMVVLPVLFVVSAASTGMAAVLLGTYAVAPDEAASLPQLSKAGLVLPVVELVLVVALLAVTAGTQGSAAVAGAASVASLMSGAYAVPFWLGFVALGLVLPFALELYRHRSGGAKAVIAVDGESAAKAPDGAGSAGSGKTLAFVGEAGVLIGGFMLRYLVIMAALAVVFA